jgi:hypothetical protein
MWADKTSQRKDHRDTWGDSDKAVTSSQQQKPPAGLFVMCATCFGLDDDMTDFYQAMTC